MVDRYVFDVDVDWYLFPLGRPARWVDLFGMRFLMLYFFRRCGPGCYVICTALGREAGRMLHELAPLQSPVHYVPGGRFLL